MAMSKFNVKNGTPVGSLNLCERCSWGQCMKGYRDSDRLVICNKTSPDMVVPFTMLECTCFVDKNRPDWVQMQKLAIHVNPVRVSSKTAGFSTVAESRPVRVPDVQEDDEEFEEDEGDEAAVHH